MILPLGIDYPYQRAPIATISLIIANVFGFWLMHMLPDEVVVELMLWPNEFAPWQWWTSGFLHGGIFHLGGNMLFLWVFGRYVEERLGRTRYLLLYAAFAPVESLVFILFNLGGSVPAIGASGVISAMMGVVMVVAPGSKVKTFVWFGPILRVVGIAAGLILAFWILEQVAMASFGADGIAFSSHFGGFAAGLAAGLLLRSDRMRATLWYVDPGAQSREDLDARSKAKFYSAISEYTRGQRESRVGTREIPDWLKPNEEPELTDPYEREQLSRWNSR